MHGFLRFVGLLNAAVWLGASVFFTVAVGPAFFSPEMLSFLPRPHAGRAAEVILARYFLVFQCCGGVAVLHGLLEYGLLGRPLRKVVLGFLAALLVFGLAGGFWLLPRMHELQRVRYSQVATVAQKAEAGATFNALHGISQALNLLSAAGLVLYFWHLSRPVGGGRFAKFDKFKA